MSNELFIGALDLSPYLTQAHFDNSNRWVLYCWNVPEGMCVWKPIIRVPIFFCWHNYDSYSPRVDFWGLPTNINSVDFLFLELAPYVEINLMFQNQAGRFGFHIKTRLYLALGEAES